MRLVCVLAGHVLAVDAGRAGVGDVPGEFLVGMVALHGCHLEVVGAWDRGLELRGLH